MKRIEEKKSERNYNPFLLPVGILLFLGLCVGLFFLTRYIILEFNKEPAPTEPVTPTEEEYPEEYNTLLTRLNQGISTCGYSDTAESVTAFKYDTHVFCIAGSSSTKIYSYSVDLTTVSSVTDTLSAYNYVLEHQVSEDLSLTLTVDQLTPQSSSEFIDKYVTDGVKQKTLVGSFGSEIKVYSMLLDDGNIKLVYDDLLDDTLNDSYSPLVIEPSNNMYSRYKYYINK